MLTLKLLDKNEALLYQRFTYPAYRSLLERDLAVDQTVVAVTASFLGEPVGLALALAKQQQSSAEVLSIFVEHSYRRMGIGAALLIRLEEYLINRDYASVELVYTTGEDASSPVEGLLAKCNWAQTASRMMLCKGKAATIMTAAWMKRYSQLPSTYSIIPWIEISEAERQDIQRSQMLKHWIPDDLVPFHHEAKLETLNSLALRYNGKVLGWVINHRLSPETIRYSCSFVRADLQKLGRIISLYAEAGRRQLSANVPNCIWTVPVFHESMARFVRKRWVPYLSSLQETKGSFKRLK